MRKFLSFSGAFSTLASIAGIVFYFTGLQTYTIICAICTLIDSFLQIKFGEQNNLTTEIISIIIGIIIALFAKVNIIGCASVSLCIVNALMSILGIASIIIYVFTTPIAKIRQIIYEREQKNKDD